VISESILRLATVHEPDRDREVVMVAGEIDLATAPVVYTYLRAAVDAHRGTAGRVVTVDLSEVTFMDASGLTALLRAQAHSRRQGGDLQLAALCPRITRLLHITGLAGHFALCPTTMDSHLPATPSALSVPPA
jgi:anti-sigma B factor antagonist